MKKIKIYLSLIIFIFHGNVSATEEGYVYKTPENPLTLPPRRKTTAVPILARNGLNQRRGIGPPEEVRSHRIQTKTEAERTKPLVFIDFQEFGDLPIPDLPEENRISSGSEISTPDPAEWKIPEEILNELLDFEIKVPLDEPSFKAY